MTEHKAASGIVGTLLCGMSLDSIRIYSVIVLLGFFRPESPANLPIEVWVSVSGGLRVDPVDRVPQGSEDVKSDFFLHRASVLRELYLLMGKEVLAARVCDSGALEIDLGDSRILAHAESQNFEEIWAVMSDSPDSNKEHRWYVSLADSGHVTAKVPDSSKGPSSN